MVLADIKNKSEIVFSALIVIIQLCNKIISAKICMYDLEKCLVNVEQLQALCNAANSGSTHERLCPKSNDVKSAMELCSKKFDYVEKFSKMIEVVVKYCDKISKGTVCLCMCVCVHVRVSRCVVCACVHVHVNFTLLQCNRVYGSISML